MESILPDKKNFLFLLDSERLDLVLARQAARLLLLQESDKKRAAKTRDKSAPKKKKENIVDRVLMELPEDIRKLVLQKKG